MITQNKLNMDFLSAPKLILDSFLMAWLSLSSELEFVTDQFSYIRLHFVLTGKG